MASSIPSFSSLNRPLSRHRVLKHTQVIRSQISRSDEGKSANYNIVDANLSVLREKIEEVRRKERLEKNVMMKNIGWNNYNDNNSKYVIGCNKRYKRGRHHNHAQAIILNSLELMGLGSAAIGLVFLGGTLCISLVSFVVQLSK